MKLTVIPILSILMLSFAFSVRAEPEKHWVEVEGGSWVPGAETISRIKEQIEPFVQAQARKEGRELREWVTYTFQYQGREEKGKKFVFVNALCFIDQRWQLSKQMILVYDGGTCFFNLRYDAEKDKLFGLIINGEA